MYRVTRVKKGERRLLGVVGGIVKHLNVDADPFWPRVAVFVACLIQPVFIIIYLGVAMCLPVETYEIPEEKECENEPKNFKDFQEKEKEPSEIPENE